MWHDGSRPLQRSERRSRGCYCSAVRESFLDCQVRVPPSHLHRNAWPAARMHRHYDTCASYRTPLGFLQQRVRAGRGVCGCALTQNPTVCSKIQEVVEQVEFDLGMLDESIERCVLTLKCLREAPRVVNQWCCSVEN